MVEVMVGLLLLAFVLLGFDAAEVQSLRQVKHTYYQNIAIQQIINASQQMHALNHKMNQEAVSLWNKQNAALLPNGYGQIQGQYPWIDIIVFWGESNHMACRENKIRTAECVHFNVAA